MPVSWMASSKEVQSSWRVPARGIQTPALRYLRAADKLPVDISAVRFEKLICPVKLFNPSGVGTWWIAAYDPETEIAEGVAEIHCREFGGIYMPELVALRCPPFGLPIERDLHYKPKTVAELLSD